MIFRNGRGRFAADEKWRWNNEDLEIVKEYKYLGVLLTPQLSFKKHLQEKLKESKRAINSTWNGVLSKRNIAPSTKYKIFEAVMRSIVCYAVQVWGIYQYEEVEQLLRYFGKKIFRLPFNTPNYMLHLETGLPPLYIHTLQLHFGYIQKVMAQSINRLPHKIATYLQSRNLQFFCEWSRLASDHNISIRGFNDIASRSELQNLTANRGIRTK